ncbi:MAG: alpha,alpha-trehalase TreF [Candidatus Nanohaloarchaea archaeon]
MGILTEGELFRRVQESGVFRDSKRFVDAVPLEKPGRIESLFREKRGEEGFDLEQFVSSHFDLPERDFVASSLPEVVDMDEYIDQAWDGLTRPPHGEVRGTLVPLENRYVVPGGRFREIYYWDSYFTMLGLKSSGRAEMVRQMVENFASLIRRHGMVPNGNRTYYLGRSQPPFFVKMLELVEEPAGYTEELEAEYSFWMDRREGEKAHRRTVEVRGEILNRHWDDRDGPRPESYREDLEIAESSERNREELFRDIRAACESGWDFSSRWMKGEDLSSLQTTDLLPVDLNSMLYSMERKLEQLKRKNGREEEAEKFRRRAEDRREVFREIFWDEEAGFYFDHDWRTGEVTGRKTLAALYPLYVGLADREQAREVAETLEEEFLAEGGLRTTLRSTGQQWDRPNGWAPLQWIAVVGLENYGFDKLAEEVKDRWIGTCRECYSSRGVMKEKYNVENPGSGPEDGEYSLQVGFGWTNGVARALIDDFRP